MIERAVYMNIKHTVLNLVVVLSIAGIVQAIDRSDSFNFIQSAKNTLGKSSCVINEDVFTPEQKFEIQQTYKHFCAERFEHAKNKALKMGLPAGLLSGFSLFVSANAYAQSLKYRYGRSYRWPSLDVQHSSILRRMYTSASVGILLGVYSVYRCADVAIAYHNRENGHMPTYLELDHSNMQAYEQKNESLD